jgi:flagellar basal body-associated protein FliL
MNPLLETAGQIAAIIICLFMFVFIVLAVAFNLAMALGMSWLGEKIQVIKMLRPTVESANQATESALEGIPPDQNQHGILRAAVSIPATVHKVEKKVDESTDKVADAVIEFRARTIQAKTILKTFFLPGSMHRKQERAALSAAVALNSSGDQTPMKERPEALPPESLPHKDDSKHIAPEEQIQHAALR